MAATATVKPSPVFIRTLSDLKERVQAVDPGVPVTAHSVMKMAGVLKEGGGVVFTKGVIQTCIYPLFPDHTQSAVALFLKLYDAHADLRPDPKAVAAALGRVETDTHRLRKMRTVGANAALDAYLNETMAPAWFQQQQPKTPSMVDVPHAQQPSAARMRAAHVAQIEQMAVMSAQLAEAKAAARKAVEEKESLDRANVGLRAALLKAAPKAMNVHLSAELQDDPALLAEVASVRKAANQKRRREEARQAQRPQREARAPEDPEHVYLLKLEVDAEVRTREQEMEEQNKARFMKLEAMLTAEKARSRELAARVQQLEAEKASLTAEVTELRSRLRKVVADYANQRAAYIREHDELRSYWAEDLERGEGDVERVSTLLPQELREILILILASRRLTAPQMAHVLEVVDRLVSLGGTLSESTLQQRRLDLTIVTNVLAGLYLHGKENTCLQTDGSVRDLDKLQAVILTTSESGVARRLILGCLAQANGEATTSAETIMASFERLHMVLCAQGKVCGWEDGEADQLMSDILLHISAVVTDCGAAEVKSVEKELPPRLNAYLQKMDPAAAEKVREFLYFRCNLHFEVNVVAQLERGVHELEEGLRQLWKTHELEEYLTGKGGGGGEGEGRGLLDEKHVKTNILVPLTFQVLTRASLRAFCSSTGICSRNYLVPTPTASGACATASTSSSRPTSTPSAAKLSR
jgi:hypothetical protein